MNSFSDFNIKPKTDHFTGDKIKMLKILNQEILVCDFKIVKSKFENSNSEFVMHLQIQFKNENHVLFTGSKVLQSMIEQVPKDGFPFKTKIAKEGESFTFC